MLIPYERRSTSACNSAKRISPLLLLPLATALLVPSAFGQFRASI